MAQRQDHQVVLSQEQSEALKGVFLQLLAYFSSQVAVQNALRNQAIKAAHLFGVTPKDIIKATDLSNAQVHAILKTDNPPLDEEMSPRMRRALLSVAGNWAEDVLGSRLREG